MNDPIGDMLTRIRNAQMRRRIRRAIPGFKITLLGARCACG